MTRTAAILASTSIPRADDRHSRPPARVKLEKQRGACRRERQGTAAVEFAIVAPVFLLLVFAIVEYGRMVMVEQTLTNAAREGARLGIIDGSSTANVEARVANYLQAAKLTGHTTTVATLPPEGSDTGDRISVTVSIPYSQVSWLPVPMYLGGSTLSSTAVMRRESLE